MCILTHIPANVDVPWDGLIYGGYANPDGHGWAVAEGDTLVVGKSMDLDTALDDFEEARKDMGGRPLSLFHSRIATAGTVDTFNVHPFYVGGAKDTVMAHNGILPLRWQPEYWSKDPRSDTRLYADGAGHLLNPNGVPSRRVARRIGQEIGTSNKFVFLSVRGGKPSSRIINADQGVFTQGVWFSNYTFEKPTYTWNRPRANTYSGWSGDWPGRKRTDCIMCGVGEYDAAGYCDTCLACDTCYDHRVDCTCYVTESSWRRNEEDEAEADRLWQEATRLSIEHPEDFKDDGLDTGWAREPVLSAKEVAQRMDAALSAIEATQDGKAERQREEGEQAAAERYAQHLANIRSRSSVPTIG